ncbi:MAG: glycosyltransferase family 4 protein, partial [Armatimonadaceae bacterium]
GGWDLVHCEHLRGTASLPESLEIPVVWDAVDCMSDLYRRLASRSRNPVARHWRHREADALEVLERQWQTRADAVVCASDAEAELLHGLAPLTVPIVIPNGVEASFATKTERDRGTQCSPWSMESGWPVGGLPSGDPEKSGPVLVCSGKWRHPPNREAVDWVLESIWPRILETIPDAQLWIAGAAPPRAWSRRAVERRIRILADVPDMGVVLRGADVALCAMITVAGVQNKILEALAAGLPVVATEGCAAPVAGAVACGSVVVADGADALAAAAIDLLANPNRARARGESGRQWVVRECRWDNSAARLEAVWRGVIA